MPSGASSALGVTIVTSVIGWSIGAG